MDPRAFHSIFLSELRVRAPSIRTGNPPCYRTRGPSRLLSPVRNNRMARVWHVGGCAWQGMGGWWEAKTSWEEKKDAQKCFERLLDVNRWKNEYSSVQKKRKSALTYGKSRTSHHDNSVTLRRCLLKSCKWLPINLLLTCYKNKKNKKNLLAERSEERRVGKECRN